VDRQRVIAILLEETNKTEQRYDGYRRHLTSCVTDIVELERQHKVAAKNIRQDIAAKIDAYAGLLLRQLAGDAT
jgi:hypothetical protein